MRLCSRGLAAPLRGAVAAGAASAGNRLRIPAIICAVSESRNVIHSNPEILGGTPVFVGTRVPLQALIDYLEGGHPLSEFLEDFPTVSHEQAIAALEQAKELLLAHSAR